MVSELFLALIILNVVLMNKLLPFLFLYCLGVSTVNAEDVDVDQWHFSVFVGEGKVTNPLRKLDDLKINAFPSFKYYGEKFFIDNTTIGYTLVEQEHLFIDVVGLLNDDGLFHYFDANDNYTLFNIFGLKGGGGIRGFDESTFKAISRDVSYLAGLNISFFTDYIDAQVGYFTDITGVHNGSELRVSLSKNFTFKWLELYLEVGQVQKSKALVDYYYTMQKEELSSLNLLTKYEADVATNTYYKAQLDVPISESFTFVASIKKTELGTNIKDSVLITESDYLSSFIGLRYDF